MTIDFEQPDDINNNARQEGGSNRLFIILALGLTGLIVLGLIAVGGVLYIRNTLRAQVEVAQATAATPPLSVDVVVPATDTPTPTPTQTPIPAVPTDTPAPSVTPTNTPVVQASHTAAADGAEITPDPGGGATRATNTPVPAGETTGSGEVPNTGAGSLELGLITIGLLAVLFVSRRLRQV